MPDRASDEMNNEELRINLVLRRSRDREIYDFMAELLRDVRDADRAEVVRRQLGSWIRGHMVRSPSGDTAGLPPAFGTTLQARTTQERTPPHAVRSTSATEPEADPPSKGLNKSQLDGIDMQLDFTSTPWR